MRRLAVDAMTRRSVARSDCGRGARGGRGDPGDRRARVRCRIEGRHFAGHRSRPRRRADHPCRAGRGRAGRSGDRRGRSRGGADPEPWRHIFPGRSAGRDQGVRPRRRRLYRQHRADRRRKPATGRGLCSRNRTAARRDCRAWRVGRGRRRAAPDRLPGAAASAPVAVASKSHFSQPTADYLEAVGAGEHVSIGSSLEILHRRRGQADIYPRLSPTSEWDTAAGHAVLLAAGGRVDGPDGSPLGLWQDRLPQPRVCRHRRAGSAADRTVPGRFLRRRGAAARASRGTLRFLLLDQIAAPRGEIGPIRINFAPNLAKAAAAQVVELGAHRLNASREAAQLRSLSGRQSPSRIATRCASSSAAASSASQRARALATVSDDRYKLAPPPTP